MSSCAQYNNAHSNSSATLTQPSEQIQDPEKSQSSIPQETASQREHIHIEDDNASIDELRVNGQTQTIEVKPHNNMPAYEVVPHSSQDPDNPASGKSRWRILTF